MIGPRIALGAAGDPEWFAQVVAGVDAQIGDTGSGDSRMASGVGLGLAAQVGKRIGSWVIAFEIRATPQFHDQLGLAVADALLVIGVGTR